MAAKPTVVPSFATAATNIAEPSAGVKATGWDLNAIAVSSYFNWLHKYTAQWLEYLKDGVLSGAFTFDSTVGITGVATVGGLVNSKSQRNTSVLTPTAISASQNNYAPTGHADAYHFRLSPLGASRAITGLAGGVEGREVIISNINLVADANTITLNHNNAGSSAGNRFYFAGGTDVVVASGTSVRLIYDATTSFWRRVA